MTILIDNIVIPKNTKRRQLVRIPGTKVSIPITVINGGVGPTVVISAGIHGSEYPGIAATIEIGRDTNVENVNGCLVFIHPVNIQGFFEKVSEIVPEDKVNINRIFPGDAKGTLAYKTAAFIMNEYIKKADLYIDLHSGDIHEELHPYVYYPGKATKEVIKRSKEIAKILNVEYMVKSNATTGSYNSAALNNVPGILIERGGKGCCSRTEINSYKDDIFQILNYLNVLKNSDHVYNQKFSPIDLYNLIYVQAQETACWFHNLESGSKVKKGDLLGYTTDLFGEKIKDYFAEFDAVILYFTPALSVKEGVVVVAYGSLKENI